MTATATETPTRTTVSPALREKLIDYLQDAHALEQNVLRMLGALAAAVSDEEVKDGLRQHQDETRRHRQIIEERLSALGSGRSMMADAPAVFGAWMSGLAGMVRPDREGKVGRDAYISEHVEIAAYSLLERLAERAGDEETARAARFIRQEEEEMARWIADHWDRFVDLTIRSTDGRGSWTSGSRQGRTSAHGALGGYGWGLALAGIGASLLLWRSMNGGGSWSRGSLSARQRSRSGQCGGS